MKTLFLVLLLAPVAAVASDNDRAAIEAQAKRMDHTFEARQMQVWDEVMTSDFQGITPTGTFNKPEFLAGGTEEANMALAPVSVNIHRRLKVQGSAATAEARERTCYDLQGTDGRRHHLCYRQLFSERWRKEADVWRLAQIRYSPHRSFRLDGRLITREEMRQIARR